MLVWASGLGIRVCTSSRWLRDVGVIPMLVQRLDTMRQVESVCEVPAGDGVRWLLLPGVGVGDFIDRCCVTDWVNVT
jgi:hypothetical protein